MDRGLRKSFQKDKRNAMFPTSTRDIRQRPSNQDIYTDASLEGIGAILKQKQDDGKEKPVAYFSKKLNETQKRKKQYK